MKTCAKQTVSPRMNSRDAIAAAVATILAGGVGQAWGQNSQDASADATMEEIVVTGIRHSIETSIATKRASTSIVEVVSAEDIGKLPDTSIADSIARLPGLAAQRIDGRPAAISIRGLGEDYAGALLNGRQVVSSSEGRSAEYDQFPSELVNQVIVYKTVDAGVVGQGLSGTIDIRPLMPLTLDKRMLNFNARGEHNTNGSLSSTGQGPNGSRFSASYVDQFADHKFGLALGFARLDSPGEAKKYGAFAYGDYDGQWGGNATGVPFVGQSGNCLVGAERPTGPPPDNAFIPEECAVLAQGFEASNTASKQVRDGAMAVLEFKPNDHFTSTVDLYYSKFDQDRVSHHWVVEDGLWNGPATVPPGDPVPDNFINVTTTVVNGNTIIDSATATNADSLVYVKNWNRTDKIKSIGWRNELEFGDGWKGVADLGYSTADRSELYIQSVAKSTVNSAVSFSHLGSASQSSWSTTQDLTDPNVIQLTNNPNWAELRDPRFKDEIKSALVSANRSLQWGWLKAINTGLAYNQRDKSVTSDAFYLALASDNVVVPASALRAPVTIDVVGIHQSVLTWDVPSMMNLYTAVPKDPWLAQTSKFAVHEKVTTAFLKFDIDATLGAVPVHGNIGVQVVHSKQSGDGFAWNNADSGGPQDGAVVPVHGGATYTDVLPSLNLVFDLKSDLYLRFGLGKTMARPRMDDMRAGIDQPHLKPILATPSGNPPDPGTWEASGGGKPDLRPWRAESVDLSLEKYFKKRSYIAVGGFYKHLNTFIYQKDTARDFTGFPNYNPLLTPGCPIGQANCNPNIGTFSTQDNGSGGKVYGLEISASLDGGLFTPALEGFGVILSEANTRNGLPLDSNGNPINLDGFSSTVNSAAAYFERGGFSARVSRRYRSAFTATTRGVILQTLRSTRIDAESQVDAQIGYSFETGKLKGLSLLLQGNNLTNAPAVTRQSPETVGSAGNSTGLLPWTYDQFGRVLLFGASYKL